jgi:hypothetical protein
MRTANRPRYVISAIAVLTIIAVALAIVARPEPLREVFSNTGLTVLSDAERVDAYLLGRLPGNINWQRAVVTDYPPLGRPTTATDAQTKMLQSTLLDENNFEFGIAKACVFEPGVRMDFIRGADKLQILICFECDSLQSFLNGLPVGGEDFDTGRPELVRMVKTLFPDDPGIRKLAENR